MTNPYLDGHCEDLGEPGTCEHHVAWDEGHAAGVAEVAGLSEKLAAAEARLRECEELLRRWAEIAKLRGAEKKESET